MKYTLSGASYINPILAFDTVKVHFAGPSNFFYGYREEDSFWAWNFWLADQLFGGESPAVPKPVEPAYRSITPGNTATVWMSPYGKSELVLNANDNIAFQCIFDRQQMTSDILPSFLGRTGLLGLDISWRTLCWIIFVFALGIFIIAEKMAGSVVVRFAVIAPSLLVLMLFITATFVWNRAKGMLLLVPGVAIGGFAISQDDTLSEQFHEIVLGVVALLTVVAMFVAYGIANDKFQCCGNHRGRLETITFLVSGMLYLGCILVSVLLSKSMFWRMAFTGLLFTMKFIFAIT